MVQDDCDNARFEAGRGRERERKTREKTWLKERPFFSTTHVSS